MNKGKSMSLKQGCTLTVFIYCICVVAIYFIAGEQFQQRVVSMNSAKAAAVVGEMTAGSSVGQTFRSQVDNIDSLSVMFATYNRKDHGEISVSLSEAESGKILVHQKIDASTLQDNSFHIIDFPQPIQNVKGKLIQLLIVPENLNKTNAVTLSYNPQESGSDESLTVNGAPKRGILCFSVSGKEPIFFGQHYFPIMGAVGLLLVLYCISMCRKQKTGEKSYGLDAVRAFTHYRFLLDQLVSRDFKTKYKRSVLGVLWSFLNPLLSMTVQYIVFSTIFKSNIDNFAVYLLVGIVFFNFFVEATGMGLNSIVSNASLITKVYVPKYIFPVSKVLSSAINFLLSLIPLLLVIIFTQTKITPALLLLVFPVACMVIFCIGMSMLLSSMMVFFRDTQFLWNVISMLWMYATPIFYPESILPAKWMFVFKMNPLYHFIRFARTIVLQGVSPEPQAYLFCILASIVPFLIGSLVFKKTQNKFILNI